MTEQLELHSYRRVDHPKFSVGGLGLKRTSSEQYRGVVQVLPSGSHVLLVEGREIHTFHRSHLKGYLVSQYEMFVLTTR